MVTRKRRVIEDDEEEQGTQLGTQAEENEQSMVASSISDRLKRRVARSAELSQQRSKRNKLQTDDNDINQTLDKSPNSSKGVKKEQSIPKKQKKTLTIPKKSNDDKNGMNNAEDKVKKETPSLLSGMKKPPIPKANVIKSASSGGKDNHSGVKNKAKSISSSWGTAHSGTMMPKQTPVSPSGLSPVNVASTPPPTSVNLTDTSGPTDAAAPAMKVKGGSDGRLHSSKLRQLVLDRLKDLCKDAFEKPPELHGVDLFASFLRHKDLNSADNSANNLRYDFFDVEETTGAVVLQPKIPIFPEDFPAGAQEWPLSWWGIVEPSIKEKSDEDKAGQKAHTDAEKHSKSRRDRSGARSGSGKEGNGDRYKHDNSRNTSKRASRDIYEDEHAYYDDYPPWEDRRDRLLGGDYDDGRGAYPPQHHSANYNYDHNGRSPNGYHPNSRNPHHRGGGQPFPHRTRDEPPPHSRPYPRDGPPPGDFRGGGRPYLAHGGSEAAPWEYSHRDPHGPQSRGPPPPGDDRREHRDRPYRSPHSKSERDDGRYMGRKPSSSSSTRKDRTRSLR